MDARDGVGIENMYIGRSQMQNRANSGTPCCSTSKQTWIFLLQDIVIKVAKCTEYEKKAYNFFRFLVCSQYFKFSFSYMS